MSDTTRFYVQLHGRQYAFVLITLYHTFGVFTTVTIISIYNKYNIINTLMMILMIRFLFYLPMKIENEEYNQEE